MKILVLVPSLKGDGGVANLFKVLMLNEEAEVTYMEVTPEKEKWVLFRFIGMLVTYFRFFIKLLFNNYDIVHSNPSLNVKSFVRDSGFQYIGRLFKAKRVVFFHGWNDEFQEEIAASSSWRKAFNLGFGSADTFLVLGTVFREKVKSLMTNPESASFYLVSTVADESDWNKEAIDTKRSNFPNKASFLFISRIVKEKGIYIALDAFKLIHEKFKHLSPQFVLAGDGPELPNVRAYCEKEEIPNVLFTGYIRGPQKSHFLNTSNVLLFPTYYGEGLPCTIMEAMLHGMPIVSRNVGGIPDVVKNGENGFISESKDPKEFADYIEELLESPDSYNQIAESNIIKSKANFTSKKVKQKILEIYKEVAH